MASDEGISNTPESPVRIPPQPAKLFKCYLCSPITDIQTRQDFNEHLAKAHPTQDSYHCKECNFSVQKTTTFNEHLSRHHEATGPYSCGLCPLASVHEKKAEAKSVKHLCPTCGMEFSFKSVLETHKLKAHIQPDMKHVCETCGKEFRFESRLRLHESTVHRVVEEVECVFHCFLCGGEPEFTDRSAIETHLSEYHVGEGSYSCLGCAFFSRSLWTFNLHYGTHKKAIKQEPVECSETQFETVEQISTLDMVIKSEDDLAIQTEEVHIVSMLPPEESPTVPETFPFSLDVGIFKCYICHPHKYLSSQASLMDHLKMRHPRRRTYQCQECRKTFRQITSFNQHHAEHDEALRPYQFSQNDNPRREPSIAAIEPPPLVYFETPPPVENQMGNQTLDVPLVPKHEVEDFSFRCALCNYGTSEKEEFGRHLTDHILGPNEPLTSTFDPPPLVYFEPLPPIENQESKQTLDIPLIPKCEVEDFAYRCALCNYGTSETEEFGIHLTQHNLAQCEPLTLTFGSEEDDFSYRCALCNYGTCEMEEFGRHLMQHKVGRKLHRKKRIVKRAADSGSYKVVKAVEKPFSCSTCDKKFSFESSKVRHETRAHSCKAVSIKLRNPVLMCHICDVGVGSKKALAEHLETVHPSKSIYRCRKCAYSTKQKQNFNNHHMLHSRRARKHKCRFCSLRFLTAQYRKRHEDFEHGRKLACVQCREGFTSKYKLKLHVRFTGHVTSAGGFMPPIAIKKEEMAIVSELPAIPAATPTIDDADNALKLFKCYMCRPARHLANKADLVSHLGSWHPAKKWYFCPDCYNVSFPTKKAFNQHLARHDATMRPFKCCVCSLRFFSTDVQMQHEADLHGVIRGRPKRRRFKYCKPCKLQLSLERWEKHVCRGAPAPKHVCGTCSLVFSSANDLSQHERVVHSSSVDTGDENVKIFYKCHWCNLKTVFDTKELMQQHLEAKHSETELPAEGIEAFALKTTPAAPKTRVEKNFQCYFCDTKPDLKEKTTLRVHLMTLHHQHRSYHCEECKVSFKNIYVFNRHLQGHDAERFPYKCAICPKRMKTFNSKAQHEVDVHRVQNGRKRRRYELKKICPVCGKSIPTENFEEHVETVHREEKFACLRCKIDFESLWERKEHMSTVHSKSYHQNKANGLADENAFKCYICPRKTMLGSEKLLHEHLKRVHSVYELPEEDIGAFSQKLSKNDEILVSKIFRCYLCATVKDFGNKESLRNHLSSSHKQTKPFHCKECDKYVLKAELYNQHLARHDASIRPCKCDVCPMRFSKDIERRMHEANVHKLQNGIAESPAPARRRCLICKKVMRVQKFIEHMETLHPEEKHPCPTCGLELYTATRLRRHEIVVHRGASATAKRKLKREKTSEKAVKFRLPGSGDSSRTREGGRYSLRTLARNCKVEDREESDEELKYDCSICGQEFNENKSLHNHKKAHKNEQRSSQPLESTKIEVKKKSPARSVEFKCYFCSEKIARNSKQSLRQHLEAVHSSQLVQRCKICSFSTKDKFLFNNHCSRHDRSKRPFKCGSCSLRFLTALSRRHHERFLHNKKLKQITSKYKPKLQQIEASKRLVIIIEPIPETLMIATTTSTQRNKRIKHPTAETAFVDRFLTTDLVKVYRCHLCRPPKTLESRELLSRHLASHPAQKMFHCDQCSFSTSAITFLNQHLAQHFDDGDFN